MKYAAFLERKAAQKNFTGVFCFGTLSIPVLELFFFRRFFFSPKRKSGKRKPTPQKT
ncbi:MAG: hypothetical protein IJI85_04235 [Clostridia bacterium]|nr:hypothetical protein [Clostridia bacterium]MBQ9323580.1 hypothetical protein [Clostridia bacterium]MBR0421770.1 hypothetical protein [Clostridia bacterium]